MRPVRTRVNLQYVVGQRQQVAINRIVVHQLKAVFAFGLRLRCRHGVIHRIDGAQRELERPAAKYGEPPAQYLRILGALQLSGNVTAIRELQYGTRRPVGSSRGDLFR